MTPFPEQLRPDFREQFLLRDDVAFLNHGSFGACPRPVFAAYQAWQLELEREPVDFIGRRFAGLMQTARERLAAYLGADADEIVCVPNATTGLNMVARSLPLEPGDEVLTTNHEYGALDRTWKFVCSRRGANYVRRSISLPLTSPAAIVEAIWSGVTPRTRVLFLSHIASPTAFILPIAELIQRARQAGIVTVIDGAHAPGQIPVDLHSLGPDFYSGNCHKWMMAPKGSAFVYARREQQQLLSPLVVSWGWEAESPTASRFVDEQEYQGTRDLAAYLATPTAIDFMRDNDWPAVRAACHELLRHALGRVARILGTQRLTPDDPTWFAQMASLELPPCDYEALTRRLFEEFLVEIPLPKWNGRRFIRISIQGYNRASDIDRLCAALHACLA